MNRVRRKKWYVISQLILKHRFKEFGKKSMINMPMQLDGVSSVSVEDDVYIAEHAWLMGNNSNNESLRIKEGTRVGHFVHIIALNSVVIGHRVLIADKVFISDSSHNYENVDTSVIDQGVHTVKSVTIGENSWLGENVCVLGANIGKHCIIGANSVVTSDIPDYCVAVGSPAKVIKKYDFERKAWVNAIVDKE